MAFPPRPAGFTLREHGRAIKGLIRDFSTTTLAKFGVTPDDVSWAEDYGWRTIISALINQYDVATWGTNPPSPLFHIWDLLASGQLLRFAANRGMLQQTTENPVWRQYIDEARGMLKAILDPSDEGTRLSLVDEVTGDQIFPVEEISQMVILDTRGVEFFPEKIGDISYGLTTDQSVEQFYRDRVRSAG